MTHPAISKYLQQYAEPLATHICTELACLAQINSMALPAYRQALIIPAYQETSDFLYRLPKTDQKYLAIVVINQSDSTQADKLNLELAQSIQKHFKAIWQDSQYQDGLFQGDHYDILLIDCFSAARTLQAQEGVGLARKLGADTACHLIAMGHIQSPWIFNTDADTYLPENYFAIDAGDAAAVVFSFKHKNPNALPESLAMRLYEFSLHYYVAGLQYGGSPYAFHTIGSCIAFDYRHYCKVRGFPKRNAGEDFYLLNKINKTGHVKTLSEPGIHIAERLSARVPFGTGPALLAINEMEKPLKDYLFYHPHSFTVLRTLLQAAEHTAHKLNPEQDPVAVFEEFWRENLNTAAPEKKLDTTEQTALIETLGLAKALIHAHSHGKNSQQFLQHFHHWFDGFRTLKFIHYLREHHYQSMAFAELVSHEAFLPLSESLHSWQQSIQTWKP